MTWDCSECNSIEYKFSFPLYETGISKSCKFSWYNHLDTIYDDKDSPRFVTKKWIEVYDQPGGNYNVNKEIRITTSVLRSDLCNYSDAYIIVKGDVTLEGNNDANKRNKNLPFKNFVLFFNCI